jgi:hypothetical protein
MKKQVVSAVAACAAIAALWLGFIASHLVLLNGVNDLLMKEADRLQAASKPGGAIDYTLSVANLDDATIAVGLAKDIQALAGIVVTLSIAVLIYCALWPFGQRSEAKES